MSDAVELIKSEIARRSQEAAEKIVAEAKEKAEQIVSSAERKAREVMMASVKPEIEVMRRRIMGSAMLEGRKVMLHAKDKLVAEVQEAVEDKLGKIAARKESSVDYDQVLFNLLEEATGGLGEDSAVVAANQNDLSYLAANLRKIEQRLSGVLGRDVKLTLADGPQNCVGGVSVRSKDGMRVFNNTLEGRFLNLRNTLRSKILEALLSKIGEGDSHARG